MLELPLYRLRALTLWQPMAWAVAAKHKPIENRPKPPPRALIGRPFVIHAGLRWSQAHADMVRAIVPHSPVECEAVRGAAIAVITIDRVVTSADQLPTWQRRWFFGPFGYVLRDVVQLADPIPCRGFQGFWTLPNDVDSAVRAQLAARAA